MLDTVDTNASVNAAKTAANTGACGGAERVSTVRGVRQNRGGDNLSAQVAVNMNDRKSTILSLRASQAGDY